MSVFDQEAIYEFYTSVLKSILPNASHKSVGYWGPPTTKAHSISLDLADSNKINKGSQYFYKGVHKFVHYTSIQNVINIIRSKKIRLYNIDSMDDQEEFIVSTKYLNLNLTDGQCSRIKQKIFCFSMCEEAVENNANSLSMWRQYAQDGNGLGIVFSFNKESAPIWVHYMLSKSYYSEKRLQVFKEVTRLYQDFRVKYHLSITTFDELFYKYYSFHKNKIYAHEKEVRLLYNSGFKENQKPPMTHEDLNRNGEKATYIELPLEWKWDEETKLFIESQGIRPQNVNPIVKIEKIILGYRLNPHKKSNIAQILIKLLKDYGHKPEIIESSLTPYFKG